DRMPQRAVQMHLVAIPPPLTRAREVTSLLEVGHDPLDGPHGDPHPICHLSEAHPGLSRDAEQHVGVVAQECPLGTVCRVSNDHAPSLDFRRSRSYKFYDADSEAIDSTTQMSCIPCPKS